MELTARRPGGGSGTRRRSGYLPAAAAAAVAFGVLTRIVSHERAPEVDREVLEVASGSSSRLLELLVTAAPIAAVTVSGMAAAASWRHRERAAAVLCLAGPVAVTVAASWLLKPAIARPWLDGTDYAFPSGHTTVVVAAWAVCFVVLRTELASGPASVLTATAFGAASALAVTVPAALILLRHHFLTDVVGGGLLAVAGILAAAGTLEAVRAAR